ARHSAFAGSQAAPPSRRTAHFRDKHARSGSHGLLSSQAAPAFPIGVHLPSPQYSPPMHEVLASHAAPSSETGLLHTPQTPPLAWLHAPPSHSDRTRQGAPSAFLPLGAQTSGTLTSS